MVGPRVVDVDLEELVQRIGRRYRGRIEIGPLRETTRDRVAYWKNTQFDKAYRLVVESPAVIEPGALTALVGGRLDLQQQTPQRVAHRRADLQRRRSLTVLGAIQATGRAVLEIRCEHGTYVKEWVSGDGGRTTPSLAEWIGAPCVCAQLDVLEIFTED